MKPDGLFVITCIFFIFVAWVATGGPSRPISQAGLFITPVTRPGEESQGYRTLVPANPIDTSSYPRQVPGGGTTISSGADLYSRNTTANDSSFRDQIYLVHSSIGPAASNPNQEYITIENDGTTTVTLNGWRVASAATGSAVTVPNIVLAAGQKMTIVSGRSGANQLADFGICTGNSDCIFLNRNLELFASSRETITLLDTNSKVVDLFSY
jgi:hypothetical protein